MRDLCRWIVVKRVDEECVPECLILAPKMARIFFSSLIEIYSGI